jgi:HEAT repeat protein
VRELPPEDQPDTFDVGPVKGIPIIDDDDPRFEDERAAWSEATRRAQAMTTPDALLGGLADVDWRVRHEVVDRLAVRAAADGRIAPALLAAMKDDPVWQVRASIAMRSFELPGVDVLPVLQQARVDPHPEVRWAASYALDQLADE